ncbi:MAG: hypothetical protein N2422_03010 [Rhodobacteraceae bacterium]|nr:hypothetical protein [Paracoccaceae bacterium]
MFDPEVLARWDAGLARLETACPQLLRDLYGEILRGGAKEKTRSPSGRNDDRGVVQG